MAEETLGKAIQDLRSLSRSLNKEWLEQFNIIANLQAEAIRINTARTIQVSLHCTEKNVPLKAESQIMLFRIVQEALQNSIRHADASTISIILSLTDKTIEAGISDNGKGFTQSDIASDGVGLLNMKHRTQLLGGTVEWKSFPGEGTTVNIRVPVEKFDP